MGLALMYSHVPAFQQNEFSSHVAMSRIIALQQNEFSSHVAMSRIQALQRNEFSSHVAMSRIIALQQNEFSYKLHAYSHIPHHVWNSYVVMSRKLSNSMQY